jgi:type II secretory pathway pseudopilin PulG
MVYRKSGGWTLLSNCLAIAIAAVILVVSVQVYQGYKREAKIREIAFDLQQIQLIGMEYYTAVGCAVESTEGGESYFAGAADPSWEQVSEVTGEEFGFFQGHFPWVSSYQLHVVRTQESDNVGQEHAHYHLVVGAQFQGLSEKELSYIGKRLQATGMDEGSMQLSWDHLAFVLRGGADQAYQPLQVRNMGDGQVLEQNGHLQTSRQYCR